MIDPTDLHALWEAVRDHPDTIGMVAWCRDDVINACYDFDPSVDADSVFASIDMQGWEIMAIEDGWEVIHSYIPTI